MSAAAVDPRDWVRCPGCGDVLFGPRLSRLLGVCPECGHHERLSAGQRIRLLFDEGSVRPLPAATALVDPIEFSDTEPYRQRLLRAQQRTGAAEAVRCVRGQIQGSDVVAAVMDFEFLGGSLGCAVGEMITAAAEVALADRVPLLLMTASGGARMQEGVLALMQMGKTAQALGDLDAAGVLTIALITDPTFGGVAASFGSLCDITLAESGARLGFAGRRVIQQTIGEELPANFQTAESVLECGLLDGVYPRAGLRHVLGDLLGVAASGGVAAVGGSRLAGFGEERPASLVDDPAELTEADAWDTVRSARIVGRPGAADIITFAAPDFRELRGDRLSGDCPAVLGGLGRFLGLPAVIIGTRKGRSPGELRQFNYGMPTPAGYRKAARLMRLAGKLHLPVLCLVDTPGAFPGRAAEEQGQAAAIADNLRLMAGLPVPVVSVITGEGGSGGALALAVADRVLMTSGSVYSVISPEGCAAILWRDPAAAPAAARALRVGARSLLQLGVIDGVVQEPDGGSDVDPEQAVRRVAESARWTLAELCSESPADRHQRRRRRWRAFGSAPTRPELHLVPEEGDLADAVL